MIKYGKRKFEIMEYLVSVIIPTYRRADMLPRAIDSVLGQSYKNVQVVVIDDNNPDTEFRKTTATMMQKYAGNVKVKYVCHERNMNGSVARNTGIQNADGEIIAFLDDDDEYYPDKIQIQVEYLLSHPAYCAVYCGWDREGCVVPEKEGDLSFELLSGTNLIYTNVIMMWKKEAVECGGWDETFMRHQEAAFMLRYFKTGQKIGVVKQVLVKFDTSDRSNAANPQNNEKQMDHYLSSYMDMILACEKKRPGAMKDIYSFRYRGIFLNYILVKEYLEAWKLYVKLVKKMPIKFNIDLFRYAFARFRKGRN